MIQTAVDCGGNDSGNKGGSNCFQDIIQNLTNCATIIVSSQPYIGKRVITDSVIHQNNNPTRALCSGMQCRRVYDNILTECDGVPGISSSLDSVRQGLDAFDQVGK